MLSLLGQRLLHLVEIAAVLAGAATLVGFLGHLWWGFDLLAHFRVQYFLALGVGALAFGCLRRWVVCGGVGILMIVNGFVLMPFFIDAHVRHEERGKPLRVVVFNVYSENRRAEEVLAFLRGSDADVIHLMEVTRFWQQEIEALRALYPVQLCIPREDNFGIALLSRQRFQAQTVVALGEADVPSFGVRLLVDGIDINLLATHPVPPVGADGTNLRNGQLREVADEVMTWTNPGMVVGDLNVTPWSSAYRELLDTTSLSDSAWGGGIQPTWMGAGLVAAIPIDHVLVSSGIRVLSRRVGPDLGSDHRPVVVDLEILEN